MLFSDSCKILCSAYKTLFKSLGAIRIGQVMHMIHHETRFQSGAKFYLHVKYALSLQARIMSVKILVALPIWAWKFGIVIGGSDLFSQLVFRITCWQHRFGQLHLALYKSFCYLCFRILQSAQFILGSGYATVIQYAGLSLLWKQVNKMRNLRRKLLMLLVCAYEYIRLSFVTASPHRKCFQDHSKFTIYTNLHHNL